MTSKRSHALEVPALDLAELFADRVDRVIEYARPVVDGAASLLLVVDYDGRPSRRADGIASLRRAAPPVDMDRLAELAGGGDAVARDILARSAREAAERWTAGEALALVERDRLAIAGELAAEVRRCAAAVVEAPPRRAAVLARGTWLVRWPWPDTRTAAPLVALLRCLQPPPPWERGYALAGMGSAWPGEAAPLEVARWSREALERLAPGLGDDNMESADRVGLFAGLTVRDGAEEHRYPAAGLALLYLAEREVREGLRRPAVAIDAGKAHHGLLTGWRDNPRDGRRHTAAPAELFETGGWVELMLPGRSVQLTLPMNELVGLSEGAIRAIRAIRGAMGLRNWCAMQRLLSVEGGRRGWVRWTLDEHMKAMGYGKSSRDDPTVRAKVAEEVELLTRMELVVYDKANVARHRAPLLLVGDRFERIAGSAWRLEGMELRINDLLYDGVRDHKTGELGTNWWPVPVELAQIDHVRHSYAHALGMLLAVRFRWDQGDGRGTTRLTGRKLLDLAGITYTDRRAAEAWSKLRRELDELERIGQLSPTSWDGEPWTLDGVCVLSPAAWIEDRTSRQLRAEERPVVDIPRNGGELRAWREARGWSRREAAKRLGLPASTMDKAEAKAETALGAKVAAALAAVAAG